MRQLIHIPVVHEHVEFGPGVADILHQRGPEFISKLEKDARLFWDEIEREIDALNLDWSHVRVYQEGVLEGAPLAQILNRMVTEGSRNAQIVKKMVERGAILEATEDPSLSDSRIELYKARLNVGLAHSWEEMLEALHKCNQIKTKRKEPRERFMASKINDTLKEGEVGILFVGAEHDLTPRLASDISVRSLDTPFKKKEKQSKSEITEDKLFGSRK